MTVNFNKRRLLISIIVSLLFIILIATGYLTYRYNGYLKYRHNCMQRNDLLVSFESLIPIGKDISTIGEIKYEDYLYGEKIGRVIIDYPKDSVKRMTIRDEKNGYIRLYMGNVLSEEYDYEKAEFVAGIRSYLNPKFWISGCRNINTKFKFKHIRTEEECIYINELLFNEALDMIKQDKNNKLIKSNKGRYYVN